jgi:hypothetical protein
MLHRDLHSSDLVVPSNCDRPAQRVRALSYTYFAGQQVERGMRFIFEANERQNQSHICGYGGSYGWPGSFPEVMIEPFCIEIG